MDITKAKQRLDSIAMKPMKTGKKRNELEAVKDNICISLKTNSLRQIHMALKESGFTGSLSLLHAVIKKWHTCPVCKRAAVTRVKSKSTTTPHIFAWVCMGADCKTIFADNDNGTFSGTLFRQPSKQPTNKPLDTVNKSLDTIADNSVNSSTNS